MQTEQRLRFAWLVLGLLNFCVLANAQDPKSRHTRMTPQPVGKFAKEIKWEFIADQSDEFTGKQVDRKSGISIPRILAPGVGNRQT